MRLPIRICGCRRANHLEKLRGNLADFHSIRVNNQWRLVFRWDGSRGETERVYLDDHSYR
jgi:proteic killer suppression protein